MALHPGLSRLFDWPPRGKGTLLSEAASSPAAFDAHEVLWVPTDDHWLLALHHYVPAKPQGHHPILMVHGIAGNRRHFDLDERHSLARFAASYGFDVYVLELRGAGLSHPQPGAPRTARNYGFDDYARRDLPEAISFVLQHSGKKSVHGVGHSMGGMLLFCIATEAREELRSITSIGTPLIGHLQLGLGARERRLLQLAMGLTPAARLTPPGQRRVPLKRLLAAAGLLLPLSSKLADDLLFNSANIESDVVHKLATEGIHDVPVQLVSEIASRAQQSDAHHSPYMYEDRLSQVVAPIFALSGSVDRIAPPDTVSAAVARIVGQDVRYREMGTRFGDRIDYGHVDLLLGRHAPFEVYPQIMQFIQETDFDA